MTTPTPDISVVVLNFNGRRWLAPCLDALAAQLGAPPFEIIFVDNASSDDSVAFVRNHQAGVRVHETGANLGFAGGNNAGARLAQGSILAFLNNDTVAAPDWLARLHAALAGRPAFSLVTSRIISMTDPIVIDSAGDGYLRAGGAYKRGHGAPAGDYAESREVFGACGAAFMIRRPLFEQLGGFDESFFMVYEDVDLSYRARLAGHRCWYAADAVVRHAGSGTLGVMSDAAIYYGQRNLEWTWIKNTPSRLLAGTAPLHAVYALAGLAHYGRAGRLLPALRGKWAAIRGLPRILRDRRMVRRGSVVDPRDLAQMMDRDWVAVKRREKG